jgi:hypothetical protein
MEMLGRSLRRLLDRPGFYAAAIVGCFLAAGAPLRAQENLSSLQALAAAPLGAATPRPTTGIKPLDAAMLEQEAGEKDAAVQSYTDAINLLNLVVTQPLEPDVSKVVRDRLAFAVIQLAVLQRGDNSPTPPLHYAYTLESKYLSFEVRTANRCFSQDRFQDGFSIYRVFTTRAGDDQKTGRARAIFEAVNAASNGDYALARSILLETMNHPYEFGNSLPLYLLGEVDRARHREADGQHAFWKALDERESGALKHGLYGPQILAAGAIVNE